MVDDRIPGEPHAGADLAALRQQIEQARNDLVSTMELYAASRNSLPSSTAFMVMPFGSEDLQVVYEDFIKPALKNRCSLNCVRGDDMFGSNPVMEDVSTAIHDAEIVIADLTGQNANVLVEVGLAYGFGRPILLIAQSAEDVPFNLRHRRVLIYDYTPRGCRRLENQIEEHVNQMLKNR